MFENQGTSLGNPKTTYKVLLVDDHPVVRDGLKYSLSKFQNIQILGEGSTLAQVLNIADQDDPHLIVLDLFLGENDCYSSIEHIRKRYPKAKILMFSMSPEDLFAVNCLTAGADGYLMKSDSSKSLKTAIDTVLNGKTYLSEGLLQKEPRFIRSLKKRQDLSCLTERELQIFNRVGEGKSTGEIARELSVSVKTVAAHRENIKAKLGLSSGMELNRFAISFMIGKRAPEAPSIP